MDIHPTIVIGALAIAVPVSGSIITLAFKVGRLATVIDGVEGRFAQVNKTIETKAHDATERIERERQERREADHELSRRQSGFEKRIRYLEVEHGASGDIDTGDST